jgi:hypothetical protein
MKTPVLYEDFEAECKHRSYSKLIQYPNKVIAMWARNGTKCEIKGNRYTVGWTRTAEEISLLRDEIVSRGFSLTTGKAVDCINIKFTPGLDVMEQFWILVEIVEGVAGLVERVRGIATKVFSREVALTAIFEKIAKTYQFAINIEHQLLLDQGRALLEADTIDSMLVRGESMNYTPDNGYREHVVPCIMIHNEAIRMFVAGESVVDVAQMIAENLAIVRITKDEAYKLDVELGLRTKMPTDWKFGDNIFARLDSAGILVK